MHSWRGDNYIAACTGCPLRLGIVGDLVAADLEPGELQQQLKARSKRRYRPPGSPRTRTFHWKTLQRWLYDARQDVAALAPRPRARGFALALDPAQRETLLDIRRAHPAASAELILSEAVRHGVVSAGQVSVSTLRRLFRRHGLPRLFNRRELRKKRLRWQAARVGQLWHADVCHVKVRRPDGSTWTALVHAILDDFSRYIVSLEVRDAETERVLLQVLCTAMMTHPGPAVFFVDNGPCYRGELLAAMCKRLGVRLVHAKPYDPESRGKMERLFRTMRQQCTDHLPPTDDLADVTSALHAWVDAYHRRPHGGLRGARPWTRYREGLNGLPAPRSAADLAQALETTETRRVRKDATVSIDGQLLEVPSWLAGKEITVRRCGLTDAVLGARFDDQVVPIAACDPVANARRPRPSAADEADIEVKPDLPFHPVEGWLAAAREGGEA